MREKFLFSDSPGLQLEICLGSKMQFTPYPPARAAALSLRSTARSRLSQEIHWVSRCPLLMQETSSPLGGVRWCRLTPGQQQHPPTTLLWWSPQSRPCWPASLEGRRPRACRLLDNCPARVCLVQVSPCDPQLPVSLSLQHCQLLSIDPKTEYRMTNRG